LGASADAGSPGLQRSLGRFDVIALCINSVVGAGVLAMPAELAADAGRLSLAVILVAFVVVGFLALSLAEVASRYAETGGPQLYAERTFGPVVGFTVGWLLSVSRLASTALIAQVMVNYAAELAPALADPVLRAAAITAAMGVLAVINLRGVQGGAWAGNALTVVKMLPLALIVVCASLLIPFCKIIGLMFLTLSLDRPAHRRAPTRLYLIIAQIGRWSMLDMFVVSLTVALIQLGAVANVAPGPGATCDTTWRSISRKRCAAWRPASGFRGSSGARRAKDGERRTRTTFGAARGAGGGDRSRSSKGSSRSRARAVSATAPAASS